MLARFVLLDWDGTLLNSYVADQHAYVAMFRALGIEFGVEEIDRHYSPNWYHIYRVARVPKTQWIRADRLWRAAYSLERPALLPGVRATLRTLSRRYVLGVVTSGSRARVCKQLRGLGFWKYFATRICSEDTGLKKPHPAPLRRAMKELGAKPDETVYVGDAAQDVEMARRAGVRVIGVLGPFPTAKRIRRAKPDLLLKSIRELPQCLQPF